MILMVTNRRVVGGEYSDEKQRRYGYHYLSGHVNGAPGTDGFASNRKSTFLRALAAELARLRNDIANTPKVGF